MVTTDIITHRSGSWSVTSMWCVASVGEERMMLTSGSSFIRGKSLASHILAQCLGLRVWASSPGSWGWA